MPRKLRSPLHRASLNDLAALRVLIRAQLDWERALGTPDQYLEPNAPFWAMDLPWSTILRVEDRSYARWERAPHFEQSKAVHNDLHLQKYDRRAWESKQLRAEVEKLTADVAKLLEARE